MKRMLIGSIVLLSAVAAQAGDKLGGYAGAGLGVGNSTVAKEYGESFFYSVDKKDTSVSAYKVFAGYVKGGWGAELGYYSFGTYKTSGMVYLYSTYAAAAEFSTNAVALSLVGELPLNKEFAFTGKLGVASAKTQYKCIEFCGVNGETVSKSSVVPLIGLGGQYKVNEDLSLRAEWEVLGDAKVSDGYSSAKYGYNMLSVSAQYNF